MKLGAASVLVGLFAFATLFFPVSSFAASSLSLGSTGPAVSSLQQQLQALGFYTYPTITGYFGAITQAAVEAYQTAHGIEAIGIDGPQTQASLNGSSGSGSVPIVTPTAPVTTTSSSSGLVLTQTLDIGSTGAQVIALQTYLQQLGFYTYPTITGYFGAITQAAVEAYQTAHGISAIGTVGPMTRAALDQGAATGTGTSTTTTTTTTSSSGSTSVSTTPIVNGVPHSSGGGGGGGGGGGFTASTPIITSVVSGNSTASTITITWTTDQPTTSQVLYGTTASYGSNTSVDSNLVTSHSVTITGLNASTVYHFAVSSENVSAVSAVSADQTFTTGSAADVTPPVRSAGSPSTALPLNTASTTISLTTDENATCKYSTTSGVAYTAMTNTFTSTGGTSHSSTVTGLANGGSYVYYVRCQDISGNFNKSDYAISFTVANDSTSPVVSITAPANNATVSGATLSVTATATDDVSVAGVQFELDGVPLGSEETTGPYSIVFNTTSVADGTHAFVAVARDGSGNYATSTTVSIKVDNTAPVLTAISAGSLSQTGATISWTTNESATSQVQYGLTTSYGSTTTLDPTLVKPHSVSLTGLTSSTLYHYRVISADGQGNTATSSDQTFTTTSPLAPTISAISSGTPSATTATITWTTDQAASSTVLYGTTTGYGTASTSAALVTSHSLTLTGLTAATTYHFQVGGANNVGTVSTSSDQTFTTASGSLSVTVTPSITTNEDSYTGFSPSISGGTAPYTYAWDFGDLATTTGTTYSNTSVDASSTLASPTHEYNNSNVFTAVLKVTDSASNVAYATSTVYVSSVLPIVTKGAGYRGYPLQAIPSGTQLAGIDYTVGSRIASTSLTVLNPTNVAAYITAHYSAANVSFTPASQTITIKGNNITLSGFLFKDVEVNISGTNDTLSDDIWEFTPAFAQFNGVYVTTAAASTTITHVEIDGGRNDDLIGSAVNILSPTNLTYSYFHGMDGDTLDTQSYGEVAYNYFSDGSWGPAFHGDTVQEDDNFTGQGAISSGCPGTMTGQACIHDNIADESNFILQGASGNGTQLLAHSNNAYRAVSSVYPSLTNTNVYNNVFLAAGSFTVAINQAQNPMSNNVFTNNYLTTFNFGYFYPNTGGDEWPSDLIVASSTDAVSGASIAGGGPSASTLAMTLSLDNPSINYTSSTSTPTVATYTLISTGYAFQYNDTASVTIATTSTTCTDSSLASPLATQIANDLAGITGLSYNSTTHVITLSKGFAGTASIPITAGATDPGTNCGITLSLTSPTAGTVSNYILSSLAPQNPGSGYSVGDLINISGYATFPVASVNAGTTTIATLGKPTTFGNVVSLPANPLSQYDSNASSSALKLGLGASFNVTWITPGAKTTTLLTSTPSYDAASQAIFNSWTSSGCTVSNTQKGYVDTWVKAAKADGTFSKYAAAYFLQARSGCTSTNADAYTNWVNPTSIATQTGTVTCTTTYCKSNGTTGFLDTGIAGTAVGSQNNIATGWYLNGTPVPSREEIGTTGLFLQTASASTSVSVRLNSTGSAVSFNTTTGLSAAPYPGGFAVTRNASSTVITAAEANGSTSTLAQASSAPSATTIYLLGNHQTPAFGNSQVAFEFLASGASPSDLVNMLNDAAAYLTSIGAQ